MKNLIIICCYFMVFLPLSAAAEYYKYVDEKGNVSFTDNIMNVPEDQRKNVTTLGTTSNDDYKKETQTGINPSTVSRDDRDFFNRLRAGEIDEKTNPEEFTPGRLKLLKEINKLTGDDEEEDNLQGDPRFSSPEATWALHKQALMNGDIETALDCFMPSSAKRYRETYQVLGKEEMKKLARDMNPIEQISQDKKSAEYRIVRKQMGQDITYYIYFTNYSGNWKIDQY